MDNADKRCSRVSYLFEWDVGAEGCREGVFVQVKCILRKSLDARVFSGLETPPTMVNRDNWIALTIIDL